MNVNVGVPQNLIERIITKKLVPKLAGLGGYSHADVVQDGKTISDATTKVVIYNKNNQKIAFLLCGHSRFGDICRRNLDIHTEIKSKVSEDVGSALLTPIVAGELDGVEYSIWPFCIPLSSDLGFLRRKIQLSHYKPLILKWLRGANKDSLTSVNEQELLRDFIEPLQRLMKNAKLNSRIKDEIFWQISSLKSKQWIPHYVLAHNDFWKGNVLINNSNEDHGIAIIDWAGGSYESFAIYDLVRISISLKVSRSTFSNELLAHCSILKCEQRNAMGYLIASFAFLAENLGQFPEERFIKLFNDCFSFLEERI